MKRLLLGLAALLFLMAPVLADSVSSDNSTTAVLGNGGVFTGQPTRVDAGSSVIVSVFTDQASATDGLALQWSTDGTNWDFKDTYTVPLMAAGAGKTYAAQVVASYFRVVYTNGATPQTAFRMQTFVRQQMQATSAQRAADSYSNENDLQQVWALNSIWNGTSWDRQRIGPYQLAQTPLIAGSGNVANAAAAATLTGTATTTVYLSGLEMTGGGATTGLVVTCTVTGLLGGTRSYTFSFAAGALLPDTPLQVGYSPPLPASAVNTPIVASCPAGGAGNTNATMVAHGFYQ